MPNGRVFHMQDFNFVQWVGNTLAPTAIFGWVVGVFPGVVLLAAFLFYILQMYESVTCQTWLRGRRLRKMARLKIRMAALEAEELINHPANRVDLLPARKAAQLILAEAREQAKVVIEEAKKTEKIPIDEKH